PAPLALAVVPARRARRPVGLLAASAVIAALLAVPLLFLLIESHGAGFSAVVGTATAWLVERTSLPGRRIFAVLLVVPLAIPDFVVSFGWHSLFIWVQGFRGAVLL